MFTTNKFKEKSKGSKPKKRLNWIIQIFIKIKVVYNLEILNKITPEKEKYRTSVSKHKIFININMDHWDLFKTASLIKAMKLVNPKNNLDHH